MWMIVTSPSVSVRIIRSACRGAEPQCVRVALLARGDRSLDRQRPGHPAPRDTTLDGHCLRPVPDREGEAAAAPDGGRRPHVDAQWADVAELPAAVEVDAG